MGCFVTGGPPPPILGSSGVEQMPGTKWMIIHTFQQIFAQTLCARLYTRGRGIGVSMTDWSLPSACSLSDGEGASSSQSGSVECACWNRTGHASWPPHLRQMSLRTHLLFDSFSVHS